MQKFFFSEKIIFAVLVLVLALMGSAILGIFFNNTNIQWDFFWYELKAFLDNPWLKIVLFLIALYMMIFLIWQNRKERKKYVKKS